MALTKKVTYLEESENRIAHCPDNRAFDTHLGSAARTSARAWCQARYRRPQYPPIKTQPAVQPGKPNVEVAGREDWLRALAKARRAATRTAPFVKHGLAQCFVSGLC